MPHFHLITIPPSHYCEKARWALLRSVASFKETPHVPGLHLLAVRKLGGGTSLPKLIITEDSQETRILHESGEILAFADTFIKEESLRLYPVDKKEEISAWEEQFDKVLGPHVRRWGYCYLLYHKGLFPVLSHGVSLLERVVSFLLLPLLRPVIYKSVGCGKENAKEISFRKITDIFSKVNEALADGRPFICGETFTAADLTFASLGAPVVLPKEFGGRLPTIEACPPEMAEAIKQSRETPAGKVRIYFARKCGCSCLCVCLIVKEAKDGPLHPKVKKAINEERNDMNEHLATKV